MCVAAFLMSQIERKKLIKSTAFKQQPRGGTDMRKALAGRQTMCRALKNGENKQLWVMGTPISNFQNDSTQLSLGNACLSPLKGDLCKVLQQAFHQHCPELGPKQFCLFALWCIWGLHHHSCWSVGTLPRCCTETLPPLLCHQLSSRTFTQAPQSVQAQDHTGI